MDNCTCVSREIVSIVYGNDFTIETNVSVYDKDEGLYKLLDLTGVKECQMRLVGTYRKVIGKDVTVSGSKVSAFFPGGSIGVGTYGVEITFVDSIGKGRIFERNLISIVSASGEATVDNNIEGETGEGLNVTVNVLTRTVRIGGSGSGVSDYSLLENKPSIGGVTLDGDKTADELGLMGKGDAYTKKEVDDKIESLPDGYTKAEADGKFETKEKAAADLATVTEALEGKVDKVAGKGLSTNDYTDADKAKIAKYPDVYFIAEILSKAKSTGDKIIDEATYQDLLDAIMAGKAFSDGTDFWNVKYVLGIGILIYSLLYDEAGYKISQMVITENDDGQYYIRQSIPFILVSESNLPSLRAYADREEVQTMINTAVVTAINTEV